MKMTARELVLQSILLASIPLCAEEPCPKCIQGPASELAENKIELPAGYDFKKEKLELTSGDITTLENLSGKPTFLTALYTTCSNPYKCPATAKWVANFAKTEGADKYNILIVTYDENDSAEVRKEYVKEYNLPDNVKFCKVIGNTPAFFKSIGFRVSYNKSRVSLHAREYKLLDSKQDTKLGQVADTWDNAEILRLLKTLESASEKSAE